MQKRQIKSNIDQVVDDLLKDAKEQLRIVHSKEDQLIKDKIAAAIEVYQDYTNISLCESEYIIGYDDMPDNGILRLLPAHADEIIEIKYYDVKGYPVKLQPHEYIFDDVSEVSTIQILGKIRTQRRVSAIQIKFKCNSMPEQSSVLKSAKNAVFMMASHWYENREEVSDRTLKEVPGAAKSIMDLHKIILI